MKCQNCGADLPDGSMFCNKCGASQSIHTKKARLPISILQKLQQVLGQFGKRCSSILFRSKKNTIIASIIGIAVIIAIIVPIIYFNNPTEQFISCLNSNNTAQAMEIYNSKIKGNTDKENLIQQRLISNAKSIYEQFKSGKTDYNSALSKLNSLNQTGLAGSELESIITNTNALNDSKTAFQKGIDAEKAGNYESAIEQFHKVISEDSDYKNAMEQLTSSKNKYISDIINKTSALTDNDEIKKQIDNIANVENSVGQDDRLNKVIDTLKQKYSNQVLEKANSLVKQNEFDKALNLLNDNLKYEYNSILTSRVTSIKDNEMKAYNTNLFNQLKHQLTIHYDTIDKEYTIVAKGNQAEYSNLSETVNVSPRITIKDNEIDYMFFVGFIQEDWVFTTKITFACDANRYEYTVDSTTRRDDVGNGLISETMAILHDPSKTISQSNSLICNMSNLIEDISKSKSVQIRFNGTGYRDHTLVSQEKSNILTIWKFYNLLESDNSLVQKLG